MNVLLGSKLTKKYLLITLVVLWLTLSFLFWMTIRVMNDSFQSQIEYRDNLIAQSLTKRLNFMINKVINDIRLFSPYLLQASEQDRQFYLSEMERMVGREPLYMYIQVFDAEGNELARIPELSFGSKLDLSEIYQTLPWSKTYMISDALTLPGGMRTIAVAYPAIDEEGTYRGGIVSFINLETFSDYLQEVNIGNEGLNLIIDNRGTIIAHSNKQMIGENLHGHVLTDYLRKERYGIWKGMLFGEKMIVSYKPLFLGKFGLIVAEPVKQANAPAREVAFVLLQVFLIVLLIAVILTVILTSRVVKPILALTNQARAYKKNRNVHFEPVKTNDELEVLALVMDQMARELMDKERRLFYILESIPYCVITTDNQGIITTFNRAAEELTLNSREDVIGKSIFEIPLKEDKEKFLLKRTLEEGKEFDEAESYIIDRNNNRHDVKIYSSLLRGVDQSIIGTITVIRDVSEIKRLEEYVRQKERLAALGQLTAGIAHEIKNPLSIIQAAAEAIELERGEMHRTGTEDTISEFIRDILDSTERMNRLLSDFLMLTKGEGDGEKTECDIISVLDELVHLMRKRFSDAGIEVIRSYEVPAATVMGNRNRLIQVFLNVFFNSIQAMEQTGGTLQIRVKERSRDWLVEIEDSGKGIPAAQLKWIFNPFYSTKEKGTGLGLSISHEIIVKHQGKIWAESMEGKGTTIFVQLPKMASMEGEVQ